MSIAYLSVFHQIAGSAVNIKDLYGTIIKKKEIQSLLFEECPYCNELSFKDNKYCENCSMDKGSYDIEHYKKCPYCSAFVKKEDQTCINCKKNIADKIKHMYEYCPHCYNQSETIFNICEHCGNEKK